jgi:phosphatidate phosphatase APP1
VSDLRRALHALLAEAEVRVDDLRARLRSRGAPREGARPHLFGGHGNHIEAVVRGRVLDTPALAEASPEDSAWRNLLGTLARLESDEVPGAVVRVRAGEVERDVIADEEGYFEARFPTPAGEGLWRPVEATLVAAPEPWVPGAVGRASYQVPAPGAEFGIISDLDDTVIRTEATSLFRMARRTFLDNAHTREAFDGVATFYRALAFGPAGVERPFFYVSSSPWNLFDLLVDFLHLNGIPPGTLLLKDYGLTADHLLATDHVSHKLGHVLMVMDHHPELGFVLMGDSGQDDAEVYARVVDERPGRVRAVYLRDVVDERSEVRAAVEEIAAAGVPAVLGRDTGTLAQSAADAGLVAAGVLEDMARAREERSDAVDATEPTHVAAREPPAPVVDVPAPDLDAAEPSD